VCSACGTVAHQPYTARLRGQLSSNVRPRKQLTVQAAMLRMRSSGPESVFRFGEAGNANSRAASLKAGKRSKAEFCVPPLQVPPHAGVRNPPLTPRTQRRARCRSNGCTPGTAQRATPSSRSGAAAAEYGSRIWLVFATATSTADRWISSRRQRGAGGARWALGKTHTKSGLPEARPNPSLEPTRYGRHCKPGLSQWDYRLSPGLQYLPPRAAQLER